MYAIRKLARLRQHRLLRLHPQQIRVRRKRDGPVDRALRAPLIAVVPLNGARRVPVPERGAVQTEFPLRDGERFGPRYVRDPRGEIGQGRGGRRGLDAQGVREDLAVDLEPGMCEPIILDGLQRVARQATCHGIVHDLDERTSTRVRTADDKRMVTSVDVARDERRGLGVSARDDKALDTHDVELKPDRNKPVDVLLDGDEHFAAHVTALFRARRLVLDVNTRSTLFDEKLCKFHGRRNTAVASVCICYDRSKIIDWGDRGKFCIAHTRALFALLAVVEKLSSEKVLNLIWYRVIRVILEDVNYSRYRERRDSRRRLTSKVGARFMCARSRTGRLPARYVDCFEILCHLGNLNGVQPVMQTHFEYHESQ